MEAFLAAQALCGGENSDSDSIRSEFSETYGALSYQRRPGSGRRKKQAPWRSPWDASVNTNYAPQYLPQEYAPSRLGIEASTAPASPIVASLPADDATPVSTPNPATPGFKSKKAKQDLSGPCCHCNATTSPQWRKGPKGKPVLCNACGIRFLRTRTLGKAMPKKRRTTAAAGSGDHMGNAQHKRIRADEPSTEEEDLELNADEVMAADDAHIAVDDVLEEANSGSLNHSSMAFSDLTAAAAAMGHQADHHAYQHPAAALLPISRLAVASSAAGSLHDETGFAETQEFGQYSRLEQQQYTHQLYTEQHYTGSTAGAEFNAPPAVAAASFVPQFGWPVTSINPLGPNAAAAADTNTTTVNQQALQAAAMRLAAAAAARNGGTTSSSSGDITGHMYLSPATSTGLHQPLAAGSRLLLNAGVTNRVSNSPSLAAALAMQQQQRSCSSEQQQPQSPLALGIYSSSAVAGSPISHQSALQSHLKAEFSGFSYGTGSGPASPLALPPAAAAAATSSGLRHMPLSSNSSGGIYSTFNRMHQQQHGLHGPSPLSVMAAAAAADVSVAADQLAQPAADAATAAPPRQHTNQQHGDMAAAYESADSGYDISAAAALDASAATAAAVTNPDVTHLMRLVANALGGMGNTWEILKSLNNSTGTHAAAAAAAGSVDHVSGISRAVHLQQQQQQQYQ